MRALVTGAQGFMGSWLVSALLDRGDEVSVLARDAKPGSRFEREALGERTAAVRADLLDRESLRRAIAEHEVDTVFHLAAQTLVSEANRDPAGTFETNVRGTWQLLDACRAAGDPPPRVVLASSYHAYGKHAGPLRETTQLRPSYPYDASKAAGDLIAGAYAGAYELPVGVLRLANVFGGGDMEPSRLVPDAARALVQGERPVIRSDGTPERDFLYVEDAVDAYLTVAEAVGDRRHSQRAWNAGSGRAVAIRELIERLIAVSGRDVTPDVQGKPQPRDDVDRQVLDSGKIAEELGWRPAHDLDAGLDKTWRWYAEALS